MVAMLALSVDSVQVNLQPVPLCIRWVGIVGQPAHNQSLLFAQIEGGINL